MMNKNRIQIYFGRWNGSVSEDLEETWTKLRAAADLQAMNALLIAMIGIKNRLVSRYETPFLKAAAVLDKVKTSLAELETLVGADAHLIDLWNAKNNPNKGNPSAAIQAIETYQSKRQAVRFTSTEDGTPRLSMEFQRSAHVMIDPSFAIHPKQTVGWIHENVRVEQKRLELQSKDPEHKIKIETADERVQLVYQGIKYYENESIKLPTWDQITGKATDSAIQNNDGLSYRGIAYYLICEGTKIHGEAQAAELYDNLSKYSKKSTAKTRGKMIMKEYNDLQQRHRFNSRSLKNFQVLMDELEGMNILSAAGIEALNKDKKHAEKYS
jgi:hypothetical protein